MTTAIKHAFGQPYVHDPITNLSLTLPDEFRILRHTQRVWVGGSQASNMYLLIERIPASSSTPTLLADGELDLYLAATGTQTDHRGIILGGTLNGMDIKGYLHRMPYDIRYSYLFFLATRAGAYTPDLPTQCMRMATNG